MFFSQFVSIFIIGFFGAMLPGPDFAMVVKNALLHSRKAGFFTALGIAAAISVHMTYCVLGVAILIQRSVTLFDVIKYIGASYLFYLGVKLFLAKQEKNIFSVGKNVSVKSISNFEALKQGFLCNILNPKATLFFLSIFTVIVKPETPALIRVIYALEIIGTSILWFSTLTLILSHTRIKKLLQKAEQYIAKFLGCFLIVFGVLMVFLHA